MKSSHNYNHTMSGIIPYRLGLAFLTEHNVFKVSSFDVCASTLFCLIANILVWIYHMLFGQQLMDVWVISTF